MHNPLVSIILPNFNHAPFLQKRLDSIFNQTWQNFELILLDDCSTDSSLKTLEKYKNHPNVSHFIVNDKNSGSPFKQWEKGISLAKGDYIWIAESDDFCELNFLESQLTHLKQTVVAVAKTLTFSKDTIGKTVSHPVFRDIPQEDPILFCPILNVSAVLFKAELLKKINHPEYATFEIIGDRVFYFEYFRHIKPAYNTATLCYFRQSELGVSSLDNKSLTHLKKYFNEHCRFINYAVKLDPSINRSVRKQYIKKFFNRVRFRISKSNKLSIHYFKFYLAYKMQLVKLWY